MNHDPALLAHLRAILQTQKATVAQTEALIASLEAPRPRAPWQRPDEATLGRRGYRPAEVAGMLGIATSTVNRWCKEDKLPYWKESVGVKVIDAATVDGMARSSRVAVEGPTAGRPPAD